MCEITPVSIRHDCHAFVPVSHEAKMVCSLPLTPKLTARIALMIFLFGLSNFAVVLCFTLMSAATIGGTASSAERLTGVSADELFAVFVDLRSSITFDHSIAQYEDPRFYNRAWLEDAIKSALRSTKEPDRPGLNWVQDSLLAKLSAAMVVQSVYGYELAKSESGATGLQMHVTDRCNRPSTYTIQFVLEDGIWRIAGTNHDSSKGGQAWFKPDLKPIKEFPSITLRDRTRYFNESNLGMSLRLKVKNHDCANSLNAQ